MRTQGSLIRWNEDRGFGFIKTRDSGIEVFVHVSQFPRGGRRPQVGDTLHFEIATAEDGRKQAKAVIFDMPLGRADFTLAPIERAPAERAPHQTPAPTSAQRADRRKFVENRGREPHQPAPSGLFTFFFGVLLIGALVFGYGKFLESRAVAIDTLHGRSAETTVSPTPAPADAPAYRCDGRRHCSQMRSCADATQVLRHCAGAAMDGDGDGIPCEQQWCD
jgi:cold shock CspA family protein